MMRAAVTVRAGGPEVILVEERPIPSIPEPDWVLVQVKAAGLNRSEMYTRQGHSPNVKFPRIQGIECVGIVQEDPSGQFTKGQQVAALMGEMGREYDGGYAEYAVLPKRILKPFTSTLPWATLGAVPEMYQTVGGSLFEALDIQAGETLLVRGGTSSIGLLSIQLAKRKGLETIATTRQASRVDFLKKHGADHVVVDTTGSIGEEVKQIFPNGVNKVLELVGTATMKDSLRCCAKRGVVCMTGILGNSWELPGFQPLTDIPQTVRLTSYGGGSENLSSKQLQDFLDGIQDDSIELPLGPRLTLDQVGEAHEKMEKSTAQGKMVIVMDG